MAICKINLNLELNGIELLFDEKPSADTIAEIKTNGFRWSPKNKLWYAKNTADRLAFAQSLGNVDASARAARSSSRVESVNLDNLVNDDYLTAHLHGADLAKAIREDLKRRGVKGVTVRAGKATYTTTIRVTVKATSTDFCSVEEAKERFNLSAFACGVDSPSGMYNGERWLYINDFEQMSEEEKNENHEKYIRYWISKESDVNFKYSWATRERFWYFTTPFFNKLQAVWAIANQWNYDKSDSMTDYFDVGYYLDIDIKRADDFTIRETMTDEERKALEDERKKEAEENERKRIEWEEEQKIHEEESRKYNEWLKESEEIIYNDISINDLEPSEQLFALDLVGGIGKECSINELREEVSENPHNAKALITRLIEFKTADAFERFCKLFLHDFDFLATFGGTASEDVRLQDFEQYSKMTAEQRESIDLYYTNCIGVYFDGSLKLVIDPQGFSYARYVYIADGCTLCGAPSKLEEMRTASEEKNDFYFPAPLDEQIQAIEPGEEITIFMCDGWMLNSYFGGCGEVLHVTKGKYAQYKGYYISLLDGGKINKVFIRDRKKMLIYKGIIRRLPDEVTRNQINDHMSELLNFDVMLPRIYKCFEDKGQNPIIDTWQR